MIDSDDHIFDYPNFTTALKHPGSRVSIMTEEFLTKHDIKILLRNEKIYFTLDNNYYSTNDIPLIMKILLETIKDTL